jgi:hypothetical protein
MPNLMRMTILAAMAVALCLSDGAVAIPLETAPGARISADDGAQVARRRKRRRKKKRKTAPKPAPAPEPAPAPAAEPSSVPAGGGGSGLRRASRIEFDAQLIKGQTTKAGEVQILERKDTELKSMVKRRTSFREEIIHTVFPDK